MRLTFTHGRPSALLPAFDCLATQTGAHAVVVGQPSVQAHVSVHLQREARPKAQLWLQPQTAIRTDLRKINTATSNYKGTTSAKGAGMAKSLRNSGGVPPRGRPV